MSSTFLSALPLVFVLCGVVLYAVLAGASYLVMGGYSHSRAGEFLFGGVTRSLLREFPISLVMAH